MSANDVLITGIGLLTSLGEGTDAHWDAMSNGQAPRVDTQTYAPYPVHPLPADIDWSAQMPRKEARQMEQWQRIGTYVAGLALADAGVKDNEELTTAMDMIVAAGGGERDIEVDTLILQTARTRNDLDEVLNEKLTTELRPTLFLAQLSNLLAGNISIVHKVTGSSRTFMGEEASGISALQTGLARIRSGQSNLMLVGGALNAENPDLLLNYELAGLLSRGEWQPVWQRDHNEGGGVITGSGGAFLVLESRAHAEKRGARAYAALASVSGDQVSRKKDGVLEASIEAVIAHVGGKADIIISACSGALEATAAEKAVLARHANTVRGVSGLTGHMKEAQMPFAVAMAALAIHRSAALPVLDGSLEKPVHGPVKNAIALTVGQTRGEGAALLTGA